MCSKPRLVVVTNRLPDPPTGGIPRYLAEVCAAFRDSGWDVAFAYPNLRIVDQATEAPSQRLIEDRLAAELGAQKQALPRDVEIQLTRTEMRRLNVDLQPINPGDSGVLQHADLVLIACTLTGLTNLQAHVTAIRRLHAPVLLSVLAPLSEVVHYFGTKEAQRLSEVISELADVCSHVVVPSHALGRELEVMRPRLAAKLRVCRLGAVPSSFKSDLHMGIRAHQAITVNRWTAYGEHKDLRELLSHWVPVSNVLATSRLIVAGPGEDLPRISAVFHVPVFTDEWLQRALLRSRVYISTSRIEGFGLAIAEALAQGVPVVARHVPAVAELVEADVNGYLYNGDDPHDRREHLHDTVICLLRDDEYFERLSAGAVSSVQSLKWTETVKCYLELLRH